MSSDKLYDIYKIVSSETNIRGEIINTLFKIADRLRELRDAKKDLEEQLKSVNSEIDAAERDLSDAMAQAECPNFTRGTDNSS